MVEDQRLSSSISMFSELRISGDLYRDVAGKARELGCGGDDGPGGRAAARRRRRYWTVWGADPAGRRRRRRWRDAAQLRAGPCSAS